MLSIRALTLLTRHPSLPQHQTPSNDTLSFSYSSDSDFEAREEQSTRRVRWAPGTKSPSPPLLYEQPIQDKVSPRTKGKEVHHLSLFHDDCPRDESECDDVLTAATLQLVDLQWLLGRKASSNDYGLDWILDGTALSDEEKDEEEFFTVFVDVFVD